MFRNFLTVAWRIMVREKFYTLINIAGLTAGILGCLLIALYVIDEYRFDRFHENRDRIVRLVMEFKQGESLNQWAVTGTKPGPLFYRTFPEVRSYVRMFLGSRVVGFHDKIFAEKRILYADSSIFSIFSFPLVAGDPATALSSPDRILLTRSMAAKYFGSDDPMGKVLQLDGEKEFTISGILDDIPAQSQINFDFIIQFSNITGRDDEEWYPANWFTYLLIGNENQIHETETKINGYMRSLDPSELDLIGSNYAAFRLEPLLSIHLHSKFDAMVPNGNLTYIYILILIAGMILLVACINYTNLSVAQTSKRQKEMGMRKVLGANWHHLFQSFVTEALLLSAMATLMAYAMAHYLLPFLNSLSGKSITRDALVQPVIILFLLALWFITGLFSGIYPAILFSRLKLIHGLRSNTSTALRITGGQLRRMLILFQFVVSIFLIISTLIIQQQRKYIRTKNLGYDKENIIVLPLDRQSRPDYPLLKEAMTMDPSVKQVSAGYDLPTLIRWTNGITAITETGEKNFSTKAIPVDLGFLKTLNVRILAGNDFTEADLEEVKAMKNEEGSGTYYILNESAIKELGWKPEEAIGKPITCGRKGIIRAVVQNFHIASLHSEIAPLAIFLSDEFLNIMFIKVDGRDIPATVSRIEKIWKERIQGRPFEYHFLDEDYNNLYQLELKSARFISTFAGLAIFLACLGLFGLSAFMAVRRTKEIGIRKVLGATVGEITLLLSGEFVSIVLWSSLISIPIAWIAAGQWLNGFVYHIKIPFWTFGIAAMAALAIAILTVSYQSFKAARSNPVNSLRNE